MPSMAIQLLIFAVVVGLATFVEDIYGTPAVKAVIYNTWWFELIIALLCISIIVNMTRFNMFRWSKIPVLLFHLAFIVIIIGAAFTRYAGIDGNLHVREDQSVDYITSTDTYFKAIFHTEGNYSIYEKKVRLTRLSPGNLNTYVNYNDKNYSFSSTDFLTNAIPEFEPSDKGGKAVNLMVSSPSVKVNLVLLNGELNRLGALDLLLSDYSSSGINLKIENDSLYCYADLIISKISMTGGDTIYYNPGEWFVMNKVSLYQYDDYKIVVRDFYNSVILRYKESPEAGMNTENIVVMKLESGDDMNISYFPYNVNYSGYSRSVEINDDFVDINFSPKKIQLPMRIYLDDFVVNRYHGSDSPSSFDSFVSVLDKDYNKLTDYHIYMNHILNFEGWRFYQSSFDEDEKGTVLSVTYDKWGVIITYLGYFLLALGMILSLFWRHTQFRSFLNFLSTRKAKALTVLILLAGISSMNINAQDNIKIDDFQKKVYSDLDKIWVLDNSGRYKPINTLFYEVSRKLYGKGEIDGIPAEFAIPDMIFFPENWVDRKIIKVNHDGLKEIIGITGKYAAFSDFITSDGTVYKLYDEVEKAYMTPPQQRTKLQNEVIAVDDRLNVFLLNRSGRLYPVFPDPLQPTDSWYTFFGDGVKASGMDSAFITSSFQILIESVRTNSETAFIIIDGLNKYQNKYAAGLLPSQFKNKLEVLYEKSGMFSLLSLIYFFVSIFVVFLIILSVIKNGAFIKYTLAGVHYLLWLLFLFQFAGLAVRWYITGHAPLSNGYEAMLYVSMAGLLTGLIISYRNRLLLFVTAVFAASPLFVAHLSLMNPELTNLVPVLKSYWLTIHVTTITTSYAILGFAAFLALLNIFLAAYFNGKGRFDDTIDEFTTLNQALIILGLYFLTVGSFLGGIWANESWGTYWSWDPKETWSLVSILIYSFVAHMKHIPSLRSRITFNFASLLSYSSILMTYFGVNYFLGGMHSYGKGSAFDLSYSSIIAILFLIFTLTYASYREGTRKV